MKSTLFLSCMAVAATLCGQVKNGDFSENGKFWSCGKAVKFAQDDTQGNYAIAGAQTYAKKDYALYQPITLDQKTVIPITVSLKCSGENAGPGGKVILSALFADGTNDWKITPITLPHGSYPFKNFSLDYSPDKPIKQLNFYIDYRAAQGALKVDDIAVTPLTANADTTNKVKNPDFRSGDKNWSLWNTKIDFAAGHASSPNSATLKFAQPGTTGFAHQTVILNQKQPVPIVISGWSKADNVPLNGARDYNINVAVKFQDGTDFWHVPYLNFSPGTHDWEYKELLYKPTKPVKSIIVYCRFGKTTGQVWFDDVRISPVGENQSRELAPCKLGEKDFDGDGVADIIIENSFFSLVLDPGNGGTCKSFTDKNTGASFAGRGIDYRMFTDRIAEFGRRVFDNAQFQYKILADSPGVVSVEMWVESLPHYPFMAYHKTFTIRRQSPVLEVKYSFFNKPASMATSVITPYFRGGMSVYGGPAWYYVPTAAGVERRAAAAGADCFFKDVVGGWVAANNAAGHGIAYEYDFSRLDLAYCWLGGDGSSTTEIKLIPTSIPAGKTFVTTATYFPFSGLKKVDFVENNIAGFFDDSKCAITLFSGVTLPAKIVGRATTQDGTTQESVVWHALAAGKKSIAEFPQFDLKKLKHLKISIFSGNTLILDAEKSFIPGFRFAPKKAKEKAAEVTPFTLNYTQEVETPHRKFAKPYQKGRTKILFLTGLEHGREIVELAQRFDIAFNTVRIAESEGIIAMGMGERFAQFTPSDVNRSLADALKEQYDLIVVGGQVWKHMDAENIKRIVAMCVSGNSGLLLLSPGSLPDGILAISPLASRKSSWSEVKDWSNFSGPAMAGSAAKMLTPSELIAYDYKKDAVIGSADGKRVLLAANPAGKPRVTLFAAQTKSGLTPHLPYKYRMPDFDYENYWFSLLGRAMLHTAGKAPGIAVQSASISDAKLQIELENPGSPATLSVELEQNNLLGRTVKNSTAEIDVKSGKSTVTLPLLAPLNPGMNAVHFNLQQDGKTVNYGVATINISSPGSLQSVTVADKIYHAGDLVSGKALSTGKGTVKVALFDAFRRKLAECQADGNGNFAMTVPECRTRRLYLVSTLADARGVILDRRENDLYGAVKPSFGSYMVSVGDHRWAYNYKRYAMVKNMEILRNAGVNTLRFWVSNRPDVFDDALQFGGFEIDFPIASQHLWGFVKDHQQPFNKTGDKKYLQRKPCLSDPEYLNKTTENTEKTVKSLAKFSPVSYDFGDENSLTLWEQKFDFCLAPQTLKAFRAYLKKEYGTIEALNKQWQMSFPNWDAVNPMITKEILAFNHDGRRNYSAWADHRTFMEKVFCDYFAIVRDKVRSHSPDMMLDMSGIQPPNAYVGMDLYRICKSLDIASLYDLKDNGEIIRSFGEHMVIAPWYGYGAHGKTVPYGLWRDALRFRHAGANYYKSMIFVDPDLTIPRTTQQFLAPVNELRNGISPLLRNMKSSGGDIAMHYSQSSIHAHDIEKRLDTFHDNRTGWLKLLFDMQLDMRFISYADIESGKLTGGKIKVLILPMSAAISAAEAAAIENFVSAGGIMIADRMAGIMDKHCRILPYARLDKVFDLSKSDKIDAGQLEFDTAVGKFKLACGSAEKNGKSGAVFVNNYGKGKAIFLNFGMGGYNALCRAKGKEADSLRYRQLLAALIEDAIPQQIVVSPQGTTGLRSFRYNADAGKNRNALYYGAVREVEAPDESAVKLNFAEKRHIYDVRNGKWLGFADSTAIRVPAGDAVILAMLPYKVDRVRLTAPEQAKIGENVQYSVNIIPEQSIAPSLHAVAVDVTSPDGKTYTMYGTRDAMPDGQFNGEFKTALNDIPGKWHIMARDVISGKTAGHTIVIK